RLLPAEVPAGTYTVLDVNVPNESSDRATTRVEVRFPPGFAYVLYKPVAGWSVDVKKGAGQVSRVIWTAESAGAEIKPGQLEDFQIGLEVPGLPGDTLTFKALQTYEGGEVVRWLGGPNSPEPAPQITVAASDGEQGAAPVENESAEDSGGDSDSLAVAALLVAILALLAGGAALARSLRATGKTEKPNDGSEMSVQTKIISGTDFITVATEDYERAARFYGETLGLEFSKRWESMPAGEFETGNLTIAVMQSDAFGLEFRANNHPIEFHVDDFEAAKAELESRGVEFEGETLDSGVCFQAFFADPDGNALAIHHRYAAPDAAPSV
ncbi:MAG TPA: DUF1775 domain-containing protein, partial [Solirubrobacterales bacterium]|nr:DUF1775 domain-containing protein [Solirubrobacterales bacterium]